MVVLQKKSIRQLLVSGVILLSTLSFSRAVGAEELEAVNVHQSVLEHSEIYNDSITNSYGEQYDSNLIRIDAYYGGYIAFDLNGAYTSVSGIITPSENTNDSAIMDIGIFADGNAVWDARDLTKLSAGQHFELDLTGVGTLEIKSRGQNTYGNQYLFLAYTFFEKADQPSDYITPDSLNTITLIDSKWFEQYSNMLSDTYGNFHTSAQRIDAGQDGYSAYNLQGKYNSLSLKVVTTQDTNTNASMNLDVYLDEELAASYQDITKMTAPIELNLEISGKTVLKFQTSHNTNYGNGFLYLVDDQLR